MSRTSYPEKVLFQKSILYALSFITILWVIRAVEWTTATDLGAFGILPRTLRGFTGIITGPLIHGDTLHLLSNTFPLILLLLSIFYFYDQIALEVFLWIYLTTGFWVWLVARQAYHIGASGLVYGLASFLFFSGIFRKDIRSIAVALCIALLYGGMIQGILPSSGSISWESHLMGTAAGILCSFYFRRKPTTLLVQAAKHEPSLPTTESPYSAISTTYQPDDTTSESVFVYQYVAKEKKREENEEEDSTASEI